MHFDRGIWFWVGVAVISLINIAMNLLHENQLLYDVYILGISVIVVIVYAIILMNRKRKEK